MGRKEEINVQSLPLKSCDTSPDLVPTQCLPCCPLGPWGQTPFRHDENCFFFQFVLPHFGQGQTITFGVGTCETSRLEGRCCLRRDGDTKPTRSLRCVGALLLRLVFRAQKRVFLESYGTCLALDGEHENRSGIV